MRTHVQRLTIEVLEGAWYAARSTDHMVELFDDTAHVAAAVDPAGHVVLVGREDLYRTAP